MQPTQPAPPARPPLDVLLKAGAVVLTVLLLLAWHLYSGCPRVLAFALLVFYGIPFYLAGSVAGRVLRYVPHMAPALAAGGYVLLCAVVVMFVQRPPCTAPGETVYQLICMACVSLLAYGYACWTCFNT